jgi:hypothetical protein
LVIFYSVANEKGHREAVFIADPVEPVVMC